MNVAERLPATIAGSATPDRQPDAFDVQGRDQDTGSVQTGETDSCDD